MFLFYLHKTNNKILFKCRSFKLGCCLLVEIHVLIDSVSLIIRRKMNIKKIKNFRGSLNLFFYFIFNIFVLD